MIKANYHTHTYLCGHATGEIEEYIITGIENGLEILGFTDHVPYPYPNGYISEGIRMLPDKTKYYIDSLLLLKEKYKNDIKILIGYEVEYYPELFDKMLDNINQNYYDYLICGQHFLDNEYDSRIPSIVKNNNREHLKKYVDTLCDAIDTKKFSCLAHPDLFNFTENEKIYVEENYRLCEYAKLHDIPLELNILGLKGNRNYPRDSFWEIVSQVGNKVIIGCDAHDPKSVANSDEINLAYKYLEKFNLIPIDYLELK